LPANQKDVFKMPLFVIFIFGAVVFGSGALLAPAWPTKEPRIGLMAALALALVMGGSIFWSSLFGWNTLVVDYLLFALLTAIFLFGTLSFGQRRAEARGEEYSDAAQGWPGPRDVVFFVLVALLFVIPALILPVPLDTDAQGFGYLGLLARLGGNFQTLAPWHPEVEYLYAPGFITLIAYLSEQLNQGIHTTQLGVAAVLALLVVWLGYDLGSELRDKRLGRMVALVMVGSIGLFTTFMDSHYTTLLGLVFALAFLICVFRYLRQPAWPDAVAAGLLLGALILAHPDTTIILALGYVPWLLTMWLGKPRPTFRTWIVLAGGVPLIALVAISPWLISIRHLLGSEIVSPFTRNPEYWRLLVFYQGIWIVPVAILGAVIGLRERRQEVLLSIGWIILVIEFAVIGLLEQLSPALASIIHRYDYPFSIAWHGPIIPYAILGGVALLWIWDRWCAKRLESWLTRAAIPICVVLIALGLVTLRFNQELLVWSKDRVAFFGAFASAADVRAMEWIKNNTPPDSRVLNFPGSQFDNSHEGDWVPVIAERDSVYFRWQPFFRNNEAQIAEQEALRAFWLNPVDPTHAELLRAASIDYVIVPQLVTAPASITTMFRWRAPFTELVPMQSTVAEAAYLRQVFDDQGAQVYEVLSP
jgi:hypothetical protein